VHSQLQIHTGNVNIAVGLILCPWGIYLVMTLLNPHSLYRDRASYVACAVVTRGIFTGIFCRHVLFASGNIHRERVISYYFVSEV